MLQPGTGLGKAQSLHSKNVDVISRPRGRRNDAIHETLVACTAESYHATQIASIGRHRDVIDDGVIGRLGASARRRHRHRGSAGRGRQRATGGAEQPGLGRNLIGARRTIELHHRYGHRRNVLRAQPFPQPAGHVHHIAGRERKQHVAECHAGRRCHPAQFFRAHRAIKQACRVKRATIDSPPAALEPAPSPAVTTAK
jgi:hypothetical protein